MPAATEKEKPYKCTLCKQKPYSQASRFVLHMRRVHPIEWTREQRKAEAQADDESTVLGSEAGSTRDDDQTPTWPVHDVVDKIAEESYLSQLWSGLQQLPHALTTLPTRLRTTNQVDDEDYDSEEEDAQTVTGDPMDVDLQTNDTASPPLSARYIDEFEGDIAEIGVDNSNQRFDLSTLWRPFRNGYEFKLARWFMDAMISKKWIDIFFNEGLARKPPPDLLEDEGECFTSAHTLSNLLDDLDPDLAPSSWKPWTVNHHGVGKIEFRYRSVETMIRHIFKQRSHAPYMVYKPIREYTGPDKEYRILNELHTAEWWWKMQVGGDETLSAQELIGCVEVDPKRPFFDPADLRFR